MAFMERVTGRCFLFLQDVFFDTSERQQTSSRCEAGFCVRHPSSVEPLTGGSVLQGHRLVSGERQRGPVPERLGFAVWEMKVVTQSRSPGIAGWTLRWGPRRLVPQLLPGKLWRNKFVRGVPHGVGPVLHIRKAVDGLGKGCWLVTIVVASVRQHPQ